MLKPCYSGDYEVSRAGLSTDLTQPRHSPTRISWYRMERSHPLDRAPAATGSKYTTPETAVGERGEAEPECLDYRLGWHRPELNGCTSSSLSHRARSRVDDPSVGTHDLPPASSSQTTQALQNSDWLRTGRRRSDHDTAGQNLAVRSYADTGRQKITYFLYIFIFVLSTKRGTIRRGAWKSVPTWTSSSISNLFISPSLFSPAGSLGCIPTTRRNNSTHFNSELVCTYRESRSRPRAYSLGHVCRPAGIPHGLSPITAPHRPMH